MVILNVFKFHVGDRNNKKSIHINIFKFLHCFR